MTEKKLISLEMPTSLIEKIRTEAKRNDMTVSYFIRYVLKMYLENIEQNNIKE